MSSRAAWPCVASLSFALGGCQTTFDGCERGQEDCPCNLTECLDGLTCVDEICVAPDESNLLSNPSFEEWAGGNAVFWDIETEEWEPTEDDPAHGVRAARVTSDAYGDISQTVTFSEPLPAGTQFAGTARVRYADGDSAAPFIGIGLTYADGEEQDNSTAVSGVSPNQWTQGSVAIQATASVQAATLHIDLAQGEVTQTLDIDDATLTQVE